MKNIQKYCNWTSKKPSLRKINSLLHLLSKYFEIEKVRVKVSLREEQIQKARKEWLKARDESERLLKIYKTTKGDFYKSKMSFFNLK
jgi:septum formation topological specificity factor MinE